VNVLVSTCTTTTTTSTTTMAAEDDIAIASVAALAAEPSGGPRHRSSSPSAGGEPSGPEAGTLLKRFESIAGGVHQRMEKGPEANADTKSGGGMLSKVWARSALLWGSTAGGAVLGLALYFRPEPLLREQEGEEEEQEGDTGSRKFSRRKLAVWVGGAFAAAAIASLASSRFKR
jgi:hypothetical protein